MGAADGQRRRRDPWNPGFSKSFGAFAAISIVAGVAVTIGARSMVEADREQILAQDSIGKLDQTGDALTAAVSSMQALLLPGEHRNRHACLSLTDVALTAADRFEGRSNASSEKIRLLGDVRQVRTAIAKVAEFHEQGPAAKAHLGALLASVDRATSRAHDRVTEMSTGQRARLDAEREKRQDDFLLTALAFFATVGCGSVAIMLAGVGLRRSARQAREVAATQAMMTSAEMDFDDETGLLTASAFEYRIERELEVSRRRKLPLTIVLVHLDQFAHIQEVKGEEYAGRVLRTTAHLLEQSFRATDVGAKFENGEFGILLPNTRARNAEVACERMRQAVENEEWEGCRVTVSLGAAQADLAKDVYDLLHRGRTAVDYARRTGRNRVSIIESYVSLAA